MSTRREHGVVLDRSVVPSPIGELVVVTRGGVVCAIAFGRRYDGLERGLERRFARIDWSDAPADGAATTALGRYFDGDVRALEPLAADPGGSPFQRAVWDVLRRIPPGETRSYLDVARRVGKPDAVRAVARANATNPVPLIIPCHRVIGADGSLTGFGGGLDRKRWLLRHEAAGVEFALR